MLKTTKIVFSGEIFASKSHFQQLSLILYSKTDTMKDFSSNTFYPIFQRQKEQLLKIGNTTCKKRIEKLNALKNAVETDYREALKKAIYADFKKPSTETDLTEIYPVISEIKYVKKHLKRWMKRQYVTTPLPLTGSSSYIKYEPKGVCLIISPWNFPINLTLGPLITAIAAGNTVVLKPSEFTPHTSAVLAELIGNIFNAEEVTLVEGAVKETQELLALPFNHIFFTGSPKVGKIVMEAAAKNLSSVTLELGGKSPTIVDKTANIKKAAKKIAWGKYINNGQVCLSPDYLLLHKAVKMEFLKHFKSYIEKFYTNNPQHTDSYCRIINDIHFERLKETISEAEKKGATVITGGLANKTNLYIAPTVITDVPKDTALLKEEIFGPILPVLTYENLKEAIDYINSKEKPLALYIFSKKNSIIQKIIHQTRAGSTCINNTIVQYSNPNLPFGGSNNSGIGKSHGFYGFRAFSNERAILKQHTKSMVEQLYPPYNGFKQKLVNWTIKWF